jgi:hypothetical protein
MGPMLAGGSPASAQSPADTPFPLYQAGLGTLSRPVTTDVAEAQA